MAAFLDGKANEASTRYLAEIFGLPRATGKIILGASSRSKTIEVARISRERLNLAINTEI